MKRASLINLCSCILLAAILCAVLSVQSLGVVSVGPAEQIIPDGNGRFYRFFCENNVTVLERFENDSFLSVFRQSVQSDAAVASGCGIIISSSDNKRLTLFTPSEGTISHLVSFDNFRPKKNCIAADRNFTYYAVDKRRPDAVEICSEKYTDRRTVQLPSSAASLFWDAESERCFALLENGVYDLSENVFISSQVPGADAVFNGHFCFDKSGGVYRFSAENGFSLVTKCSCENLCVASDGTIFASSGDKIFIMDENGEAVSSYSGSGEIDCIMSSGKNTVFVCDEKVCSLDTSLFKKEKIDIPDESSDTVSSEIPEDHSESFSETEPSVTEPELRSSVYNIEDGMIKQIPPGTVASVFLKNIDYHGGKVSLWDRQNKMTSSGRLGTGWTLHFSTDSDEEIFQIIVSGDLTGEGNTNTMDVKALSEYFLGKNELDEKQKAAADIDVSGKVDMNDMYDIFCSY